MLQLRAYKRPDSLILLTVLTGLLSGPAVNTAVASQKVVVVVDDSGSMADWMRSVRTRKVDAARQALFTVLEQLPDDSKLGILALNRGWLYPLGPLDRNRLTQSINQLRARGSTPLGASMSVASDALLKLREEETYGDFRLLVVSDGEAGDQALLDHVLPDIMGRGFLVDVIGVDMKSDHSLATRVHSYRKADDPDSLEQAIASALAEGVTTDVGSGESDFELLAGLPVDVVPFVISSLTSTNNTPVSGNTYDDEGDPNGVYIPPGGGYSAPSGGGGGGGGASFRFGGIFCMFILFLLVSTVSSLFRSISRPKRRRW